MKDMLKVRMYSTKEFAEIVGMAQYTARRYAELGKLPFIKLGGTWKMSEENLKKYLNGELQGNAKTGANEQ